MFIAVKSLQCLLPTLPGMHVSMKGKLIVCILSTVLARACPKASFGSTCTTNIAQDQRSLYQSSVYLSNRDQTLTSYYIGPLNLLCEDSGMDAQTELYRPIPYLVVLVILWSHEFMTSLLFLTYWM